MAKRLKATVGVYEREPGSNVWYGRIRVDGKLVRKGFGAGTAGRADAVAWVEKARTVRRTGEGILPKTAKRPTLTTAEVAVLGDTSAVKVGQLCDEFLRYVRANPAEYRDQKNPPHRLAEIKKAFGDREAARLRPSEIEAWLDRLQRSRDLAPGTVNKLRGTFSMIYKHGRRKDLVDVNPAADVPLKEVGHGIERFLSDEEERRLRDVLQRRIDSHDATKQPELRKQAIHRLLEFEVSLKSGMRRSEQYGLRWSDVDLNRRVMRLRMTKNGKPRNAYIIDDVAAALEKLRDLDLARRDGSAERRDLVFAKIENKKWWDSALREAKIRKYRWHDNRHTFCSRLVQAGVHLKVVQEAAGHSSIASTMRYAHLAESEVVKAMAVLNAKRP